MTDKAIKGLEERIIQSQRPQEQICKGLHQAAVNSGKDPYKLYKLLVIEFKVREWKDYIVILGYKHILIDFCQPIKNVPDRIM